MSKPMIPYCRQFSDSPNRIDLLTTVPGIDFESCFQTRQVIEIDGVAVNFIDLDNLKKNKRASGRTQDLADLEKLEKRSDHRR